MNKYLGGLFSENSSNNTFWHPVTSSAVAGNLSHELYWRNYGHGYSSHNPFPPAFGLLYFSTKNNKDSGEGMNEGMKSLYESHPLRAFVALLLTLGYFPAWALSRLWISVGVKRGTSYPALDLARNATAFTGLALFHPVVLTLNMRQKGFKGTAWQVGPALLSLGVRYLLVRGFMSNHLMQDALQRLVHLDFQGSIGQVLPAVLILWATASLVLNDAMQIKLGLEKAYRESPGFDVFWDRTVLALTNPAYVFHKKKADPSAGKGQDSEKQGADQDSKNQGEDQDTCCDFGNRVAAIVLPTAALAGVGYALYQSNMMHQMVQSLGKQDFSHLLNDQLGVLVLTVLAVGWAGCQAYAVVTGSSEESGRSATGAASLRGIDASKVDSSRQSQGGRSDSSNFLVSDSEDSNSCGSDSEDYDEEDYPRSLSL
jgi:hypothetical protein